MSKLTSFSQSVSRDIEADQGVSIGFLEIIAMIQALLAAFPCFGPQSPADTVAWLNDHPRTARAHGIREIRKSDGVKRKVAAQLYDRAMDSALALGDDGFAEVIAEAKAGV